ncbi:MULTISPECIES: leucyl aminopeptidase [unclassified Novosphingobium]|uniref:leucyl aminopeptidase n=1 Tax=unclassified Novosphingobium TaxID=2644732 RepID=UPI000EE281AC|nr:MULTISPECIES: leucyl aminopeptidase [unclassified Novosphingobium]HCF25318.1 leucyl aminopeptidase [Novosphingobium sp.]HQV03579.1 leucyl aminopeptidase [Novosphingobium sp.]
MQIEFLSGPVVPTTSPIAYVIDQEAIPTSLEAIVAEGARASRFVGKTGQLHEAFVSRDGAVVRVALAGAGEPGGKDRSAALERAGAAITAKYLASGESALTIDFTGTRLSAGDVVSVLLGARLRGWRYDNYRTRLPEEQKASLKAIKVAGAPEGSEAAWAVEAALADGIEFTRELVTEPANVIYPESFVERARARMAGTGITVRTLDEAEMAALGMGALLGVAQGSVRKPRLLIMEWNGGAAGERPVAFVGKGVTFDTGGISLKPPAGMEDMKWDMGGAGAVTGAMLALAKRKAKANVVGVCGLVENMPDGNAQRPGDVVTTMSGQTVEVINTDAEGRLVLCDAITWTQKEFNPTAVIDLATLTGAMIISLGHEHGGIFANDDGLADKLLAAGRASGDKLWRMPMGPTYDKLIDSPIADMKNVGPREGGSITAAQFIQRYVDKGTPWAHLDIAGMVWASKPGQTWDKGATGFGVRVLDQFVRDNLEG